MSLAGEVVDRVEDARGQELESQVKAYCRNWPVVFARSQGSRMYSAEGKSYIDFFAGAGSLNYGHNNARLKESLLKYLADDGIVQGLDIMTNAKLAFLRALNDVVLMPRGLEYKVQFTGPTGANAVEAALKLARKFSGRRTVVSFTRAFHGMSLGALAVSGSNQFTQSPAVGHSDVLRIPFEGFGSGYPFAGLELLDDLLRDRSSGVELPGAVIVETVQAEGGVNVASSAWLMRLESLCREWGLALIVDDIQTGSGRTGPFFGHEGLGIEPDIVCLSKSISGYGLPMSLLLIKPDLDVWSPGEHSGTFRGNNAAFVTAAAALTNYWTEEDFSIDIQRKGAVVERRLLAAHAKVGDPEGGVRGRGLIWGLEFGDPSLARRICAAAFDRGLLVESAGPSDEVVKVMPPLTVSDADLDEGLDILDDAVLAAANPQN